MCNELAHMKFKHPRRKIVTATEQLLSTGDYAQRLQQTYELGTAVSPVRQVSKRKLGEAKEPASCRRASGVLPTTRHCARESSERSYEQRVKH